MKKYEITKINSKSALKSSLYIIAFPVIILFLFGGLMLLAGIYAGMRDLLYMGAIIMFLYPAVLILITVILSFLGSKVYNLLSGRFGGLSIIITEKDENK